MADEARNKEWPPSQSASELANAARCGNGNRKRACHVGKMLQVVSTANDRAGVNDSPRAAVRAAR